METKQLVKWIRELEKQNRLYRFYKSNEFKQKRVEIFKRHHNECYMCKQKSPAKYTPVYILHHVKELRQYPELALSDYYIDEAGNKQIQLMPVCFSCHEKIHDRFNKNKGSKELLNEERW